MSRLNPETALIYSMIITSASDKMMTDAELGTIGEIVKTLPAFREYNVDLLPESARSCAHLLQQEKGMDNVLALIRDSLPDHLRETAYAMACDVVAADLRPSREEIRMLAILRDRLGLDKLTAAAIERGARARYQTL